jgi:hypothetical protein
MKRCLLLEPLEMRFGENEVRNAISPLLFQLRNPNCFLDSQDVRVMPRAKLAYFRRRVQEGVEPLVIVVGWKRSGPKFVGKMASLGIVHMDDLAYVVSVNQPSANHQRTIARVPKDAETVLGEVFQSERKQKE